MRNRVRVEGKMQMKENDAKTMIPRPIVPKYNLKEKTGSEVLI